MARLVLTRRARRELFELSWPLADAVEQTLWLLEREPKAGKQLQGKMRGLYSLRVGSYRVLYQLVDSGKTIRVAAIRHRAAAYKGDPR